MPLLGQALPGRAQDAIPPAPPAQVLITGSQTDTQARRDFVAGKIIIGRKRIDDSGARRVDELLKREPAVTVSSDGRIGLLNMPGYTQVLVDGQAPMAGQSPTELDLVHVEKIEIIKSSVAEYGPYGIAGTINIVMRKSARKTETQLSTGARRMGGQTGANLSLSHSQSTAGQPLRLSFDLSGSHTNTPNEGLLRQVRLLQDQAEQAQWQGTVRGTSRASDIMASSNMTWQRGANETISVSPEAFVMRGPGRQDESRRWADGSRLDVQQETTSSLQMFSLPVKWSFKPSTTSQLELRVRAHRSRLDTGTERADAFADAQPVLRHTAQLSEAWANNLDVSYKLKLLAGHDLKMGASLSRSKQQIAYDYRINALPDATLMALGTSGEQTRKQLRVHLQDEWRVSESWALSGGVAGEATALDVTETLYRGATRFHLWSPSLHASKKIGDDDKRQLRFSAARSFRAPSADDFTLRPEINPLSPCPAGGACGANTIDTPDKSGNIGLRPERSLGWNMAYEHGIGNSSQLTLEIFTRQIDDKIGANITLDNVQWSTSPRYVVRPANLGRARSAGINVEMELALRDLSPSAPKVTLRGSAALARSRVSGVPGPDNRLDQQAPWTAKLGASYGLQDVPLKFNLNANWTPALWIRSSLTQRVALARRFDLDANMAWAINKERRLVLGVTTRLPRMAQQINEYLGDSERVRLYTDTKRYAVLSVRFDTALQALP